ncbi:MAG: hypothetical protein ABJD68_10280 [Nakamurella sp.]
MKLRGWWMHVHDDSVDGEEVVSPILSDTLKHGSGCNRSVESAPHSVTNRDPLIRQSNRPAEQHVRWAESPTGTELSETTICFPERPVLKLDSRHRGQSHDQYGRDRAAALVPEVDPASTYHFVLAAEQGQRRRAGVPHLEC